MIRDAESLFMYLLTFVLYQPIFFNWVVSSFVTKMDNKTLSPIRFTSMFIHSMRRLSTLLIVFFTSKYAKLSPTWLSSKLPKGSS